MARPLCLEYEGAVYHLTARGNAQQSIFLDDDDRMRFLDVLSDVADRFDWLCHAYCLMTNHYHLLIETPLFDHQSHYEKGGTRQLDVKIQALTPFALTKTYLCDMLLI